MRNKALIGVLALIWLVLMADIIWERTDEKWMIEDSEKIGKLEVAQYTNQIIVVAVSDEGARLCMFERNFSDGYSKDEMPEETEYEVQEHEFLRWELVLETEAIIGRNGLGKTKEGDGKTPIGVFLFIKAFGILENPGMKVEYTQVNENHYWVDDSESQYYNQFVVIDEVEMDWKSAEHIVEYEECYQYVLATSYNIECIQGKGSAVFLHCTSEEAEATAGCIAIPEVYMREIMMRVEPQCLLIIDYVENILTY